MEQYISKAAVVAKIEGILNETNYKPFTDEVLGERKVCKDIKDYLDTLEGEKVDLDKEIDNVWNPHFNLGWDDNSLVAINHKSFESIAKHFFELGLKAQKGE